MASPLTILQPSLSDDTSTLYLNCQPLSQAPPEDLPRVQNLANEYWSARLVSKPRGDDLREMSDWFSLPYTNIQDALDNNPEGPLLICIESLPTAQQHALFGDTKPVFSIESNLDNETTRWLHEMDESQSDGDDRT